MVKVLQICLSSSEGGLELSTLHFAKMLSTKDFQSPVFCLHGSFIEKRGIASNLTIWTTASSLWRQIYDLYHYLKANPMDVIFIHRLKDIRIIPILKIFFPKIKIVGLAHIYVDRSKKDLLHQFLYSYFDRLISFTKVQSLALQKTLPIALEKHFVLPHGVDIHRFQARDQNDPFVQKKRNELNVSPQEILIGVVGRFDPQKGQIEMVEAALKLLKSHQNLRFIFVGEDTFNEPGTKQKCIDLVRHAGQEKFFQFLPFTSEIQFFYPALNLFVMPSYKETFGLVLIEAMSCGCPVMSTSEGGPVEILDQGQYGILVRPRSSESLLEGLLQYLNHPENSKIYSERARSRVEAEYSQERMQLRLTQFLADLQERF